MCVVTNNSSFPTVKNNNTAYHAFGKYQMQARRFKLSFKILLAESNLQYFIYRPNELEREIRKKLGKPSRGPSKSLGGHGPLFRIATVCDLADVLVTRRFALLAKRPQ